MNQIWTQVVVARSISGGRCNKMPRLRNFLGYLWSEWTSMARSAEEGEQRKGTETWEGAKKMKDRWTSKWEEGAKLTSLA